jgi:hypothetical protein
MRVIAKLVGVLFIIAALWGFVETGFAMETSLLMGIFPVNAMHNVAHLLLGVWGYASSQTDKAAGRYGRFGGVLYLILGATGFVVENPMDLLPIGGADRFLHLGVGALLLIGGLVDAARPAPRNRSRGA